MPQDRLLEQNPEYHGKPEVEEPWKLNLTLAEPGGKRHKLEQKFYPDKAIARTGEPAAVWMQLFTVTIREFVRKLMASQ